MLKKYLIIPIYSHFSTLLVLKNIEILLLKILDFICVI